MDADIDTNHGIDICDVNKGKDRIDCDLLFLCFFSGQWAHCIFIKFLRRQALSIISSPFLEQTN